MTDSHPPDAADRRAAIRKAREFVAACRIHGGTRLQPVSVEILEALLQQADADAAMIAQAHARIARLEAALNLIASWDEPFAATAARQILHAPAPHQS